MPAGAAADFTAPLDGFSNTAQAGGPTIVPNDRGVTAQYLARSTSSVSIRVTVPYTAGKGLHFIGFPAYDRFNQFHRNEKLSLVVYDDTPVITAVSPGSIAAATPTTLTISGSGFGDRPTVYVGGVAYSVSSFEHPAPGEDRVTVSVNVPGSLGGSSVSVYLVSNGAGGQAFFGRPLGATQGSPTSNTRQVAVVGRPTISGSQGIWYLGTASVNDNCDPNSPVPNCYYNSTQLTLTPGAGGAAPTPNSPATWLVTDPLTGQPPAFVTTTCSDAACSQVVIRASSQPSACGSVNVQATLGGVSSALYTVGVDWPSHIVRDDSDQRTRDDGLPGPPPGYLSYNTLKLISACGDAMFNIAVHEEFPAPPAACGGSVGWSDPIPQAEWSGWITDGAGTFVDTVGYACSACSPGSDIPGPFRTPPQPLSTRANASAALFIFVGSQNTVTLGRYFPAEPRKQVRYTDNGRDEPGTWTCPTP